MSLTTDRILLESKIRGLQKDFEVKNMEASMFVEQIRNYISPYLELEELEIDKAKLALDRLIELRNDMKILSKDIKDLERKL